LEEKQKFKIKKANKKVIVAAWSDSKTSESESDEEQVANIYLMAKEIQYNEITKYE